MSTPQQPNRDRVTDLQAFRDQREDAARDAARARRTSLGVSEILTAANLPDNGYLHTVQTMSDAAIGHEIFRIQQPREQRAHHLSPAEVIARLAVLRRVAAARRGGAL